MPWGSVFEGCPAVELIISLAESIMDGLMRKTVL